MMHRTVPRTSSKSKLAYLVWPVQAGLLGIGGLMAEIMPGEAAAPSPSVARSAEVCVENNCNFDECSVSGCNVR